MAYYENVVSSVGSTPLIKLNRITEGLPATIALKGEFNNPLGSVKDRIGAAMISAAEKDGRLKPGTTIIEPTSGNTGIALAFVAASRGYKLILTMPESMSLERRTLLALLGAHLVLTPAAEGMKGAIARAEQLHQEVKDSWLPQQFDNPAKALFKNVPVLETGGRAATNTFVQKEIGDVLLTFESEVLQITKVFSPDKFDVVYPPLSILAEAPVSVVDKVVDRRGTRKLATDYLEYLWSDDGQKLAVRSYFRPRSDKLLAENAALFPPIKLVSVDEVFGGWDAAQEAHFADGGFFDQIYRAK